MEELVIWGAGAIGGTVGAYLSRAGQKPLLVDADKDHVAAMKRTGLKITGTIGEFATPVRAATPDEVRGPVAVKRGRERIDLGLPRMAGCGAVPPDELVEQQLVVYQVRDDVPPAALRALAREEADRDAHADSMPERAGRMT